MTEKTHSECCNEKAAVKSYIWQSVIAAIFFCPPLGILAILFARESKANLTSGNIKEAIKASGFAKMFCTISFLFGIVLYFLFFSMIFFKTILL